MKQVAFLKVMMHTEWKFEEKIIPFKMLYEEKFIHVRTAMYTAELETGSC